MNSRTSRAGSTGVDRKLLAGGGFVVAIFAGLALAFVMQMPAAAAEPMPICHTAEDAEPIVIEPTARSYADHIEHGDVPCDPAAYTGLTNPRLIVVLLVLGVLAFVRFARTR